MTTTPNEPAFVPGPILLLGAPGVGKGTQAKVLMAEFAIPQISTGDLLRQHRADHTELGNYAEKLMQQGKLVSDEVVQMMVEGRLNPDTSRGFILDGFPRTIGQATWLDGLLAGPAPEAHRTNQPSRRFLPVVAISIAVEEHQLLERITGRRISPAGRIYNVYSNPPQVPGICDVDGSLLVQRTDDTESVFYERMSVFNAQTAPVVDHYRAQGRFEEVDGSQSVEAVTEATIAALHRLRAQHGAL